MREARRRGRWTERARWRWIGGRRQCLRVRLRVSPATSPKTPPFRERLNVSQNRRRERRESELWTGGRETLRYPPVRKERCLRFQVFPPPTWWTGSSRRCLAARTRGYIEISEDKSRRDFASGFLGRLAWRHPSDRGPSRTGSNF